MKFRFLGLLALTLLVFSGCKGRGVAGAYHIEQDGAGFGPGAEKIDMHLKDDKSFDIAAGPLTMASGTWKEENGQVVLSASSANLGTTYKIKDGKLMPVINGKDVTFWRWVRK